MADREFIIDILLKARDDTARAFAAATGNMEAYNALLEEQRLKSEKLTRQNQGYIRELERSDSAHKQAKRGLDDLGVSQIKTARAINNVEEAQRRVTRAQIAGEGETAKYALLTDQLGKKEDALRKALQGVEKQAPETANAYVASVRQRIDAEVRSADAIKKTNSAELERQRILNSASGPARTLANPKATTTQDIEAERALIDVRRRLESTNLGVFEAEKRINDVRAQSLRTAGFASQEDRNATRAAIVYTESLNETKRALDDVIRAKKQYASGEGTHEQDRALVQTTTDAARRSGANIPGNIIGVTDELDRASSKIQQFQQNASSTGSALLAFLQPAAVAIGGLVGSFGALASAAVAAGTAIGGTFIAGVAQGIPVMGVFAASLQRLQQVMGYVQTVYAQAQQKFIAAYQTAYQNSLGLNQVTIAQHNYSNALYASQQAVLQLGVAQHSLSDTLYQGSQATFNLKVAQLGLLSTRQQAARQLQQLIFQEVNARLAAEASTLAVTDSQKALAQAIATGGDVQQAQLQLQQAQASHVQSVSASHQAIVDASRGSIARQQISQNVQEAQNAVTQAQRAIVDSRYAIAAARQSVVQAQRSIVDQRFALAQARAAIIMAQQAAAGYNVGVAAQLAWLRSQMTKTELSLGNNILSIYKMFQGVHGRLRPVTDAILGAFIPLTQQIHNLFMNPRIFGGLLAIANQIGGAIRRITSAVFSSRSINNFVTILHDAARNIGPLVRIGIALFQAIQRIVIIINPYLHQFLLFLAHIAEQFSRWVKSSQGQNWIKKWFDEAFKSLEAFIGLGVALVRLLAAIAGTGGGAKTGIGLIRDMTDGLNKLTNQINHHTGAFYVLKQLWSGAEPVMKAIATILGALVTGLAQITSSSKGQQILSDLANIFANVLVPAVVNFTRIFGPVLHLFTSALTWQPIEFLAKWMLAGLLAARGFLGVIQLFTKPLILIIATVKNLFNLFTSLFNIVGKTISLLSGGRFGFGTTKGGTPEQQAARIQLEAANIGKANADKQLEAARMNRDAADKQNTAADKENTAGDKQNAAGDKQKTAGETQDAAGDKQQAAGAAEETAGTEQVTAGTEEEVAGAEQLGGGGGGLLSGLASGGLAFGGLPLLIPAAVAGTIYNLTQSGGPTTSNQKITPGQLLTGGGLPTGMFRPGGHPNLTPTQQKLADAYAGTFTQGSFGQQSVAGAVASAGTGSQLSTLLSNIRKFPGGDIAGGVGQYLNKWIPSANQVSLIGSSNSALAKLRQRAQQLLSLPDLTGNMRAQLGHLISVTDSTSVAVQKFKHIWDQTFQSLGVTTPHVVNKVVQQLQQDANTIASNFKSGTHGWVVATEGLISSGVAKWQQLVREGVSGTGKLLDKLTNQLHNMIQRIGLNVPKALESAIVAGGESSVQGFLAWINAVRKHGGGGIGTRGNVGAVSQHGGPVPGYGGGDIIPYHLEPGEHVLTKEEVGAAGGHGAIFAMRRSLGGGRQGGPRGFAVGGQVGAGQILGGTQNMPQGVLDTGGTKTQGVTGWLGSALANVQNFRKQFLNDWTQMWNSLFDITKTNVGHELVQFNNFRDGIANNWSQINRNTSNSLDLLVQDVQNSMNKFMSNMKTVLNQVTQDVQNAFYYIRNATNSSLKAFQAKPINISLGALPKFAGGGFIGQAGERGSDAVMALLGRGEAVLNYAHQKVVEPAMRAFYGFGLGDMFKKVRGVHGGEREPGGYSTGGYIYPFPSGTVVGRTDQGIDANMPVGSPIGPIGRSRVKGILPDWYKSQPLVYWEILDGARAGKYAYVSEQITNIAPPGTLLQANQAVARYASTGTGIEYGWATSSGETLARATTGYTEGQVTPAGTDMRNFLTGLAHGKIIGGQLGGGAIWKAVKQIAVQGGGALKTLIAAAIKKVTGAANKFGQKKAGSAGGGNVPGQLVGNIMHLAEVAAKYSGVPWVANIVKELLMKESSGGVNEPPSGSLSATGPFQVIPSTFAQYEAQGHGNIRNPFDNALAAFAYIKSAYTTLQNLASRTGLFTSSYHGYGSGGFAGEDGQPVPIIAHVGEWVLNKVHQSKLARSMGTSVDALRAYLGLSGGKKEFDVGGVVGEEATRASLPYDPNYQRAGTPGLPRQLVQNPGTVPYPEFQALKNSIDTISYYGKEIHTLFSDVHADAAHIANHSGNMTKALKAFTTSMNNAAGDSGLFALAAQAVNDFVTKLQTSLALAAVGVHKLAGNLVTGAAPTALAAARESIRSLTEQSAAIRQNIGQDTTGIRKINRELEYMKNHWKKGDEPLYQQLLADLKNLTNLRSQGYQSLAQALSDRSSAVQQDFQSEIDRYLRSGGYLFSNNRHQKRIDARRDRFTASGLDIAAEEARGQGESLSDFLHQQAKETGDSFGKYLKDTFGVKGNNKLGKALKDLRQQLGKIGPGIAAGIASMNQTIAQTLGDPRREILADTQALSAAQETRNALKQAYAAAARRAAKDPRWQKVADDLLGQLETAQTSVVQAQAQALQDQISRVDTRAQIQSVAIDMRNRLIQASVALGRTPALSGIGRQIDVSRANTANLQQQLSDYQALRQQATREGNVQAINDLTQKIEGLRASIQEANVTTQQLITSLHETAITMLTNANQTTNGFFQSAQGIVATLGQITGSLNLPQQIQILNEVGVNLRNTGQDIASQILESMNDPKAFGAFQNQVAGLLGPLMNVFTLRDPQKFATTLAEIGPQLADLESRMPQDVGQLFQSLVQAMIDNTTATVDNSQQLQQLNATTNQQQFTSSAWTMFRQAIFSGLGTLLPTYAMSVPTMDTGGLLKTSGLLYGHADEVVVPATVSKGEFPSGGDTHNHFNFEEPMEVADPVHLGNAIAFRLSHDPNSR